MRVILTQEEGLSNQHVHKITVSEAGHGGGSYICFDFREGVTIIFHAVSQNLSDLIHDGQLLLNFRLQLWSLHLCYLEIFSILLLLSDDVL